MPRAGRELEVLVRALETALAGSTSVHVESPYYAKDKHTGQQREADVAVIGKIGSADVLVIFECRDRKAPADSRWIEEIATKRESMSAQKAVAVSSVGFTRPARSKAASLGIEIRTLQSIKEGDVPGMDGFYFRMTARGYSLQAIELVLGSPADVATHREFEEAFAAATRRHRVARAEDFPLLVVDGEDDELDVHNIILHAINGAPDEVFRPSTPGERTVIQFLPPADAVHGPLFLKVGGERLLAAEFEIQPHVEGYEAKRDAAYSYHGQDGEKARLITYSVDFPGGRLNLQRIIPGKPGAARRP